MADLENKESDKHVDEKLAELRKQVDSVDSRIVELLAERQKIVDNVVAVKKAHNLPVYHPAREEDLISQRRAQSGKAGLDPDYIEDLFRRIMRQSRVEQTAKLAHKSVRPGATVLIVGGPGAMGKRIGKWFTDAGYDLRILDEKDWQQAAELCKNIDLALISVPIEISTEVIHQLGPHLPEDCVLSDITSIKKPVLEAMLNAHPGPVIGLHPLFGPGTTTMDKQIIAVTPGRRLADCQWVLDQLTTWGSIILQTGASEHDEIMSVVQALRHFATFIFGNFLYHKKINLPRTLEFSSPIYRLELSMVGRLFAQDPALYTEIIFSSPERIDLLKEYIENLSQHIDMLDNLNKDKFNAEFKKIAQWFGPFSEQALRESGYLIEKIIERF